MHVYVCMVICHTSCW